MGFTTPTTEDPAGALAGQDIIDLLTPYRAPLLYRRELIEVENRRATQLVRVALAVARHLATPAPQAAPASAPARRSAASPRTASPAKDERPLPDLMTPTEVRTWLDCSTSTLDRLRRRRPDIACRPAGRWRYRRDRIEALLADSAQGTDLKDFITTNTRRRS